MATATIDETLTDAFMPDPEKLRVAQAQPVNLKAATPDPDEDVELELEDDGKGENEDDEPKNEAEEEDEEDDTEEDGWDKDRQKRDEEDAKSGRSKADVEKQNEELQGTLQSMEKRLTELAEKVSQPAEQKAAGEESEEDEPSSWQELDEEDEITGEELPQNKAINAAMKAQAQENAAMRTQMQEFMTAQEARQEQAANQEAYQGILRKAAGTHSVKLGDLNARVRQEWERRGYSNDFYPDEHQTDDAVHRIAQQMEIESLRGNAREGKRKAKQPPATDTGKGGKTKVKYNPHQIFTDFGDWLKGANKRGEFADVQG